MITVTIVFRDGTRTVRHHDGEAYEAIRAAREYWGSRAHSEAKQVDAVGLRYQDGRIDWFKGE